MESVIDWSGLLPELLSLISICIPTMEDFTAFRGVCTSWRAAAIKEDEFLSVSKLPLLMLSNFKFGCNKREFYSLSKRKICTRMSIPGVKSNRCVDVGFGWILTLAYRSGDVTLVRPFSSAKIELPNYRWFTYFNHDPPSGFMDRAWLTANPSKTSDFKVLVSTADQSWGFWENGDQEWTKKSMCVSILGYCKGKLYTMDEFSLVSIWDPQGTDLTKPQKRVILTSYIRARVNTGFCPGSWLMSYLVESTDGELLMITRNNVHDDEYVNVGTNHFGVIRLDIVNDKCKEIHSLGNDAIFVGNNVAVSVDVTEFPSVLRRNCIYFTDDCMVGHFPNIKVSPDGGGKDMGIYNLEDQSIERFNVESYDSLICPPMWIFPSF